MKPILVNVDYDEQLAGLPSQAGRMLALEFLAFWLVKDRPIRVHRDYPAEFLDYIQKHTGHRPDLRQQGTGENWWGELKHLELERQINSKVWSFQWWQSRWKLAGKICRSKDEIALEGQQILKRAQGMSGRGNRLIRSQEDINKLTPEWFESGAVLEPLRERVSDLSALWLSDEQKFIFYRNDIDDKFQWRGVVIENGGSPKYSAEELAAMGEWESDLTELRETIQQLGYLGPFSVDAFFYRERGVLKFHPCSEVNARKTMGWLAFQYYQWQQPTRGNLFLSPKKLSAEQWKNERELLKEGDLLLSPPDAPFTWIWTEANSPK